MKPKSNYLKETKKALNKKHLIINKGLHVIMNECRVHRYVKSTRHMVLLNSWTNDQNGKF